MPINLGNIRDELLPSLMEVRGSYTMIPQQWEKVFLTRAVAPTPIAWPIMSLPMVAAVGAAAAIIKNPEVSRRRFFAWLRG